MRTAYIAMRKVQKIAFFTVGFALHLSLTIWIFFRIATCGIIVGCVKPIDRLMGTAITFPLNFLSRQIPWKGQDGTGHGVSWDLFFLMWPVNSLIVVAIAYFVLKFLVDRVNRVGQKISVRPNYSLKRTAAGRLR